MQWPPDFAAEWERRELVTKIINSTPDPRATADKYYANNPVAFVRDNCITYDPRNPARKQPATMPFIPFPKQVELIEFFVSLLEDQEPGLIEKSRDMGATWIAAAFSVWLWNYQPGASIGWGSRKEALVDKLGDPDSIFEKIRKIIRALPWYCVPEGFNDKVHATFMRVVHPDEANGATITGEAGDNIGRGGRKSIYFKDESAHYDRPELIEAALGDNTNVQVDISSVCGEGTVFHRRRVGGSTRVFVMDWSDHPAKDQAWYDKRKQKAVDDGLAHIFAQEVDRDYSAAVEGIFIPAEWVRAAKDAHIKLGFEPMGTKRAGLDVADEGGDKNALTIMQGGIVQHLSEWAEGDVGETAIRAWEECTLAKVDRWLYDSIGVGAGVKAKTRELLKLPANANLGMAIEGFAAGGGVRNADAEYAEGKTNKDMFKNVKAQGWWTAREMFRITHKAIQQGNLDNIPTDMLVSIPSTLGKLADDLISELSRPKREADNIGRVVVESKDKMKKRGIKSPNLADSFIMCVVPDEQQPQPRLRTL